MKRLTAEDWNDVADLLEQGAVQARDSRETHSSIACEKAAEWMDKLAMKAARKALALTINPKTK